MKKVRLADYGAQPLKADHIDGDATVLTVAGHGESTFDGRKQMTLTFGEFPDLTYFLNVSILGVLVAMLGDDADAWIGKRIPLEKISVPVPARNAKTPGETVVKLYPVDPAEWNSTIAEYDKAVAAASAPKPAARKRAGK